MNAWTNDDGSFSVSSSQGRGTYHVSITRSAKSCSCPAYLYGRGKDCKHIRLVLDKINRGVFAYQDEVDSDGGIPF